ncbi:MAG: hypothetical protein NVSMB29_16510 [Candidatus Dormibacteria bacterium]
MFSFPHVNLLAVVAAAVASFVVGGVYWAIFTGAQRRSLGKEPAQGPPELFPLATALGGRLVAAFVLSVYVGLAGLRGAGVGAEIGFLAWLGFVLTLSISQTAFDHRPWKAMAIGLPEALIAITLMGGIVGAWR